MSDDALPIGQKSMHAPDGCGFSEEVVLPVRVHLVCLTCKLPMLCIGAAKPSIIMGNTPQTQAPKFMHVCPSCKAQAKADMPFPQIRHEPHPHIAIGTEDEIAAQQAAEAQKDADVAAIMAAVDATEDSAEG